MIAAFLPLRLEGESPGGVVGVQFFGPYLFFFGDSLSGDGASWVWTERPDGPASLVGRLLRKARMLSWSDLRGERKPSSTWAASMEAIKAMEVRSSELENVGCWQLGCTS